MVVKDLKQGMLLTPTSDIQWFCAYRPPGDHGIRLVYIRGRPFKRGVYNRNRRTSGIKESRTAVYLGTKVDLNLVECSEFTGVDKFIYLEGEIFGVDPPAWSYLKPVEL